MKFAYENLSSEQFEELVIFVCQYLLGQSVQGFAKGPDGGRDAKFVGTAELHPSRAQPWVGKTIIQAKHTNGYNKHFSEGDFFNPKGNSNIIMKEIPRIQKLRQAGDLDHYMLFSNRKLSANADNDIRNYISEECSIPYGSIYLCDVKQIEIFMKNFPDIPRKASLNPLDSPLIVSPDELAAVIEALANYKKVIQETFEAPPIDRISYAEKNILNNMSEEYAKVQRRNFLKETAQIRTFLSDPENSEFICLYTSIILEFNLKIIAKRREYDLFDDIMNYLADLLFERDPILEKNKQLTRTMLFYMYWNCDIGMGKHD